MLLKSSLAVLPLWFSFWAIGQNREPIPLQEVTVRSARVEEFAVGAFVDKPDTLLVETFKTAPISALLMAASGASIKSYGYGGLSSVSMRGGGTAHTAVLWNGINIQSPMNGGVDFSGMPVAFFPNIQVQPGGSGTLYGSGAMSGVIHLSGQNLFKQINGLELDGGIGDFHRAHGLLSAKLGNQKAAYSFRVLGRWAENDFLFENTTKLNAPLERQTNAGLMELGVTQETQVRFSQRTLLTTGFWYHHNDKDLPTQMTNSRPNRQNQTDDNLFGSLNFRYYGDGITLNVKQGLIHNRIDYSDPLISLAGSKSNSFSWVSEAEGRIQLSDWALWNVGVNYTHDVGNADGYNGSVSRNRLALFSFIQMKLWSQRMNTVVSVREEVVNSSWHPLVFSLGNDLKLGSRVTVKSSLSKTYRIPSLNDLYWRADSYSTGNPDLEPESGWSGEGGILYTTRKGAMATDLSAVLFFTYVDNWIVWLQEDGIWEPFNKKTGRSHGLEFKAGHSGTLGNVKWRTDLSYYYTHSRLATNDAYDGKQMVYVPRHKANVLLTGGYRRMSSGVVLNYSGERYYDYRNVLKPYITGDLFVNWKMPVQRFDTSVHMRVNNIWNTDYQVMAFYAMPRRNVTVAINVKI